MFTLNVFNDMCLEYRLVFCTIKEALGKYLKSWMRTTFEGSRKLSFLSRFEIVSALHICKICPKMKHKGKASWQNLVGTQWPVGRKGLAQHTAKWDTSWNENYVW